MKPDSLRAHWQKHLESQKSSDLSIRDYCFNNQLKSCTFYHWRKKLRRSGLPSTFAKVKIKASQSATLIFGMTRLELPAGTDLDALAELMLKLNGKS